MIVSNLTPFTDMTDEWFTDFIQSGFIEEGCDPMQALKEYKTMLLLQGNTDD